MSQTMLRLFPELAHLDHAARERILQIAVDDAEARTVPLALITSILIPLSFARLVKLWTDTFPSGAMPFWPYWSERTVMGITLGVMFILVIQGSMIWAWYRRRLIHVCIRHCLITLEAIRAAEIGESRSTDEELLRELSHARLSSRYPQLTEVSFVQRAEWLRKAKAQLRYDPWAWAAAIAASMVVLAAFAFAILCDLEPETLKGLIATLRRFVVAAVLTPVLVVAITLVAMFTVIRRRIRYHLQKLLASRPDTNR